MRRRCPHNLAGRWSISPGKLAARQLGPNEIPEVVVSSGLKFLSARDSSVGWITTGVAQGRFRGRAVAARVGWYCSIGSLTGVRDT
jgi:hypothetical protein